MGLYRLTTFHGLHKSLATHTSVTENAALPITARQRGFSITIDANRMLVPRGNLALWRRALAMRRAGLFAFRGARLIWPKPKLYQTITKTLPNKNLPLTRTATRMTNLGPWRSCQLRGHS
jgi:hypothetical protein